MHYRGEQHLSSKCSPDLPFILYSLKWIVQLNRIVLRSIFEESTLWNICKPIYYITDLRGDTVRNMMYHITHDCGYWRVNLVLSPIDLPISHHSHHRSTTLLRSRYGRTIISKSDLLSRGWRILIILIRISKMIPKIKFTLRSE